MSRFPNRPAFNRPPANQPAPAPQEEEQAPAPAPARPATGFGGFRRPGTPAPAPAPAAQPPARSPLPSRTAPVQQRPGLQPSRGLQASRPVAPPPGMFTGLGAARPSMTANYVRDGVYISRIDAVKFIFTQKKNWHYIIEQTCVYVIDDANGTGHRIGEKFSHSIAMQHLPSAGNLKQFILAVTGMAEEEMSDDATAEQIVTWTYSDEQPFAGVCVEFRAQTITTRGNKPFCKVHYEGVVKYSDLMQNLTPEQVAALWEPGVFEAFLANEQQAGQ